MGIVLQFWGVQYWSSMQFRATLRFPCPSVGPIGKLQCGSVGDTTSTGSYEIAHAWKATVATVLIEMCVRVAMNVYPPPWWVLSLLFLWWSWFVDWLCSLLMLARRIVPYWLFIHDFWIMCWRHLAGMSMVAMSAAASSAICCVVAWESNLSVLQELVTSDAVSMLVASRFLAYWLLNLLRWAFRFSSHSCRALHMLADDCIFHTQGLVCLDSAS